MGCRLLPTLERKCGMWSELMNSQLNPNAVMHDLDDFLNS